jgi:hypothetical protein
MRVLFYQRTRCNTNPITLKRFLLIGFYDIEATDGVPFLLDIACCREFSVSVTRDKAQGKLSAYHR